MRLSLEPVAGKVKALRDDESGIVLILVTAAVIVIGAFMALGLGVFKTDDNAAMQVRTEARAARIMDQLASFAQNYGRIPCPADPRVDRQTAAFGREARQAIGADCDLVEGVVPFYALGLIQKDVTDGWGDFFTYRVSPVFTNLDSISDRGGDGSQDPPIPETRIFSLCRWADGSSGGTGVDDVGLLLPTDPTGDTPAIDQSNAPNAASPDYVLLKRNLNPKKAKFCCPGPIVDGFHDADTDIIMNNPRINLPASPNDRAGILNTDVGYINSVYDISITNPGSPYYTPPGQRYTADKAIAVAFVLVSHGANRRGAFLANGTLNRTLPVATDAELENSDGDRVFTDAPRVPAINANYYDDMLFYETNRSLFARLGNSTCIRSFR